MKLYVHHAAGAWDGLQLLTSDLEIELAEEECADVSVECNETDQTVLQVVLNGKTATITYGGGLAKLFRGLAILADWLHSGKTADSITETPIFETNGAMVDMSRNPVMNVKTVKTMLRKMALMGMDTFMLYTEDTYEIENRPYFGHLRGRYTKAELKELDAYAKQLGIELIPCIQVLGHLSTHLQWGAAAPYKDTSNVLLVGAAETYALIDDMLKTVTECFTSKRVHVGMDETNDIGLGQYMALNGYRDQTEVYFEHLARVIDMVHAHGLQPMMWSDMFFRLAGQSLPDYADYDERVEFTDDVRQKIPQGIQQVFWDYYHADESFYATNIQKHQDVFGKDSLFAGGVWSWSGYGPLFSRSLDFTVPALDACRKHGVREVIATVWDNGGECNLILSLAGLAWYADYNYRGSFDLASVKACFGRACRSVSYDDVVKTELCEHPDGTNVSLSRAMLYNDPLLGLADAHIRHVNTRDYYENASAQLASHGELDCFAAAYDTICKLTAVLEKKADFGVRLKKAYDTRCTQTLRDLANECDEIAARINALRQSHMAAYMEYHKPFGFEIYDLRYGGLMARFTTARERILAFVDGKLDRIEELEAERLALAGGEDEFNYRFLWMPYATYASPNRFG